MIRNILGVILGYLAMLVSVFLTFTLLYLILGAEGTFEPKVYDVSLVWVIFSVILGFTAACLGGYLCKMISQSNKAVIFLSSLILIIGMVIAIPHLGPGVNDVEEMRTENISIFDAMQKAKQPAFILLMNPIIGAFGILGGAKLKKEDEEND